MAATILRRTCGCENLNSPRIRVITFAVAIFLTLILLGSVLFTNLQEKDRFDFSLQFTKPTQRPALAHSVAALGLARDGWAISNGVLTNLGPNTTAPAIIGAIDRVLRHLRCTPDQLDGDQRPGCAVIIRDPDRRWCQSECTSWYGVEFRFFPVDAGKKDIIVQLPSTFCGSGGCVEHLYVKRKDGWRLVADVFGVIEISGTQSHGLPELILDGQFRLVWNGSEFVARAL